MPLKNYRLVVGKPIDWALDDDASPHIEVLLDVAGLKYRAAINVRSKVPPHTLVHKQIQPFEHARTASLGALGEGVFDLRGSHASLALDYVRDGIVQREEMEELPYSIEGPNNDLKDKLVPIVEEAVASPTVTFYFFGETWGPESKRDKYFHFTPGRGIHDIHMNQGSTGGFSGTNGIHQDGGLLIEQNGVWTAVFLAFSTQSWITDEQGQPSGEVVVPDTPKPHVPDSGISAPVRIIAALVNPYNPEEGRESVTLLNVSDQSIRLDGWMLQDGNDRPQLLDGLDVGAGDALRVRLCGHGMRLKNKSGGKIKLISPGGLLLQEVVYRKEDVRREGWSLVI